MKKILHIIATPRGEESRTLRVSAAFLAVLRRKYPAAVVDERNLFTEPLPDIIRQTVAGKYFIMGGKDVPAELLPVWRQVEAEIERFKAADAYVISTPMWNFAIPFVLKNYLDIIFQPRYLFRYTDHGPEGLVIGKKMAVISSRGGDYGPDSPAQKMDNIIPYLSTAFGFIGQKEIDFISAQPMDAGGPEICAQQIAAASKKAEEVANSW
ncbi:MAG TPA: NAD(P)H-dependent oxidoreductase [bacterium]|nr:NAD(P)H-dependent oxidoreductase [bacterium]